MIYVVGGFFVPRKVKVEIQIVKPAIKLVATRIKDTKKRGRKTLSIRSVFNDLRNKDQFSFVGDYPLLEVGVNEIKNAGFEVRRDLLLKIIRESEELSWLPQKDRTAIVDQLLETGGEQLNA